MKNMLRTDAYAAWLHKLRDSRAVARIIVRVDRLRDGNPGQGRHLGSGVCELKIDYAEGYRVYYGEHEKITILLLAGGTKSTQTEDIKEAKRLFAEWKEQQK